VCGPDDGPLHFHRHWKIELKFHIYESHDSDKRESQELYELFNQKLIFLNESRLERWQKKGLQVAGV
jgi:hypothetical protein